jgi:replication initiation and membrane attachment protein DnaB
VRGGTVVDMTLAHADVSQYPELSRIVEIISSENPLQRRRIDVLLRKQGAAYFRFAEALSSKLNGSLLQSDQDLRAGARAYNHTCMNMARDQIRFRKTGKYETEDASVAEQMVYSQKERMRTYVIGLLLSYLFWPNHYEMFEFYIRYLQEIEVDINYSAVFTAAETA